MRSKLSIKFSNYETTTLMIANLEIQRINILKEIIEEIMKTENLPHIEFNDNDGYVTFYDDTIDERTSIVGIKVKEVKGNGITIKEIMISTTTLAEDDFFIADNYGEFDYDEMVSLLMSKFEK